VLHIISASLVRWSQRWYEADGRAPEQQEFILLKAWLLCRRQVWKIGKFSWQPTLRRSLLNVVVGRGFNSGPPPLFHSVSLVLWFLDAASPPREHFFFWSAAADAESGELQLGPGRLRACSTLDFELRVWKHWPLRAMRGIIWGSQAKWALWTIPTGTY